MALDKVLKTIGNIGSAFSPFAGIASAVGSFFGQSNQNAAQLQAQRETNEMNYKIWQEQQQHNVDMFDMQNQANIRNWQMQHNASLQDWQLQNEYNTAAAQRQRLEEAGLNPSIMMNGGSAGVATSAPQQPGMNGAAVSPAQAPQMQTPHSNAFIDPISVALKNMSESLSSTAESFGIISNTSLDSSRGDNIVSDTNKKDAETINVNVDTGKKEAETENIKVDTGKKEAETENVKEDTKGKKTYNFWQPRLLENQWSIGDFQSQISNWDLNIRKNESLLKEMTLFDEVNIKHATSMNLFLDADTKSQILSFMPAQHAAELYLMSCQAATAVKQGNMYASQAKYYISGAFANYAQGNMFNSQANYYNSLSFGQNLDNQVRNFSLSDEKKATKYYWQYQGEQNWFDYDTQKSFNERYNFMNNLNGIGKYKGYNDYAAKLYEAAVNAIDFQGLSYGAQIYDINNHKFSHSFGTTMREAFAGWLPFSSGYNVNYNQQPSQKNRRPIGFRF